MKKLRKMIHKDTKFLFKNHKNSLIALDRLAEEDDYLDESEDDLKNMEEKIYYGSDSDGSYYEEYQKFLSRRDDSVIIDAAIKQILQERDYAT